MPCYAERAFCLEIEAFPGYAYKGIYGVAYFVALYCALVEFITLNPEFVVVVCDSLETRLNAIIELERSCLLLCLECVRERCEKNNYSNKDSFHAISFLRSNQICR